MIGLFLLSAAAIPFLLMEFPDDDTLGELTLLYEFIEVTFDEEQNEVYREDSMTYVVSPNNMRAILKTQYYCGYPLAEDVEFWYLNASLIIGAYSAVVVDTDYSYDYYCWKCEIDNETFLLYDVESGIFVHSYWADESTQRIISLTEMTLVQFAPHPKTEGVLVSGILIELAVIIWLFADRLRRIR